MATDRQEKDPRLVELGAFLRQRRYAAHPDAYGIKDLRRRRSPGLRREEVAKLAAISTTWYTWLEQGRNIHVSTQVIQSLAKVFRLTEIERQYLASLAGEPAPRQSVIQPTVPTPNQVELLHYAGRSPAYLTNRTFQVLASNEGFHKLFPTISSQPQNQQNLLWSSFMDSDVRARIVNWESEVEVLVAQFRESAQDRLFSDEFTELLDSLLHSSPEFRTIWRQHKVRRFSDARRSYRDPLIGEFQLKYTKLYFAENPEISLVLQEADDSSPFWRLFDTDRP